MSSELKFLLNSFLIIVGLFIVYWIVNRYGFKPYLKGRNLKLIERLPLSRESGLIVVEFKGKLLLCYYSKDDFKILKEIEGNVKEVFDTGLSFNGSSNGLRRDS